jgi:sarcosine oxidase
MSTNANHSTVIIVGGGGMGMSTAWGLAKAGHDVRVIEQFKRFHKRGSSHGEHRIIRRTYNDALYAALMPYAYQLWEELETDTGQQLMYLVGGLEFGPSDDPALLNIIRINQEFNIPNEILAPAEAAKRFPQLRLPPDFLAVYCLSNGFLAVDDCVRAHAEQAQRHGAVIQDEEPVLKIVPLAHGAEVHTGKGTYTCDKLVVTAGAYVNKCLPQLHLDLAYIIEQNQVQWFEVAHPEWFTADKFPVFIMRDARHAMGGTYGFPTFRNPGIKIAVNHSNHYIDVDRYDMTPRDDVTERVRDWVREFIPDATGNILSVNTCLYDFPPDEHFVIGLHPQHPDIAFANMAGHGYKFASLVGEILAQLATVGRTSYDLTGLGMERFFSETAARRPALYADIGRGH